MAGAFPEREFGQLRGQARLAKIAEFKATDRWAGSTWVYESSIQNGGAGGAEQLTWEVIPGEDNEMEVLYGMIWNRDSFTRECFVRILDGTGGNVLAALIGGGVDTKPIIANRTISFPFSTFGDAAGDREAAAAGARFLVSGEMALQGGILAVDPADRGNFSVVARVRGDRPTTSAVGNSDSAVTINREQFF